MKKELILAATVIFLGGCGKLSTTSSGGAPSTTSNTGTQDDLVSYAQDGSTAMLTSDDTTATASTPLLTSSFLQGVSGKVLAADPNAKSVDLVVFGNRKLLSCATITGTVSVTAPDQLVIVYEPATLPSNVTVSLSADGTTLSLSGAFTGRAGIPLILGNSASTYSFAGTATAGCGSSATASASLINAVSIVHSLTGVLTNLYELSGVFGPATLIRSGAVIPPSASPSPSPTPAT